MRKRYRIALALLVVTIAGVIAWQMLRPREPDLIIQGKPLMTWLEGYGSGKGNARGRAETDGILSEAGTNAIPTLLRMLRQRDDSLLKRYAVAMLQNLPLVRIRYVSAERRHRQAYLAFEHLGSTAKDAVPALIDIYEHVPSGDSKNYAACALGAIGPAAKAAVPFLLRGATGTNAVLRLNSLGALYEIHAEPDSVVPVFMNCLNDTDSIARIYAIKGLGLFERNAEQAVPALTKLLNDSYPDIRDCATNALKAIDPEAAAKAGVK